MTPGHDWNDYEIGLRHNLPCNINIFNDEGRVCSIVDNINELKNLDRFEARQKVVDILRCKNFLRETRPHATSIPVCGRTGDIVEPMLKDQWFLNVKTMANKVLSVLDRKEMKIIPPYYEQMMR